MPSLGDEMTTDQPGQSSANDDLDPATFLRSVRELSEKREREDAERYRQLEAEVEQSRAKRAARRAERARSLSPEKMKDAVQNLHDDSMTDSQNASTTGSPLTRAPVLSPTMSSSANQPQPPSPTKDIPEFAGFGALRKSEETPSHPSSPSAQSIASDVSTSQPRTSATSLARSGTLSWQQRPRPQPSARPLSMHSSLARSDQSRSQSTERSTNQPDLSRDQIASSLASRDPSWFRQTPDRGVGSAAYRKSREEASTPEESTRRGLPGMSRETSIEPESKPSPTWSTSTRAEASRPASLRDSTYASGRASVSSTITSTQSKPDLQSLVAADAAQLEASPMSEVQHPTSLDQPDVEKATSSSRTPTMSNAQARILRGTERPPSPTKGVGGFVQSAMLKRSDSMNKRWSVQSGNGTVNRQDALANARSSLYISHSMPKLDQDGGGESVSSSAMDATSDPTLATKSVPLQHSRNKSVTSLHNFRSDDAVASPPPSPPKRWSPTKASWIESALNKPDTPKVSSAKNAQPSWMADIAKAKAQRASVDVTSMRPASSTVVQDPFTSPTTQPGIPKQTPGMSATSEPTLFGLPTDKLTSPPPSLRPKPEGIAALSLHDQPNIPKHLDETTAPALSVSKQPDSQSERQPAPMTQQVPNKQTSAAKISDEASQVHPRVTSQPAAPKPALSPKPNLDFRSNLRSRPPTEPKKDEAPEFLAKFGNLRRAQTEKYVAPDILKDNITRGKSELNKTDGPVKAPKRDEFKDSLLAKKEDWKKAKEEGRDLPGQIHERNMSSVPVVVAKPEALVRRGTLARSNTAETSIQANEPDVPEALKRLKTIKSGATKPVSSEKSSAELPILTKQVSLPTAFESRVSQSSKLASRFNPGLAGVLARGPPASTNPSQSPVTSRTPINEASETVDTDAPLQDMRKGRAKGPKKRKQGTTSEATASQVGSAPSALSDNVDGKQDGPNEVYSDTVKSPKSSASLMVSSLQKDPIAKPIDKPTSRALDSPTQVKSSGSAEIADFKGFGSSRSPFNRPNRGDNKENTRGRGEIGKPIQPQSQSRRLESMVANSAAVLAVPGDRDAMAPPKPGKPSRVVSGKLPDASSEQGSDVTSTTPLNSRAEHFVKSLGIVLQEALSSSIDAVAVIKNCILPENDVACSLRKTMYELSDDESLRPVSEYEDHVLFDKSVYLYHRILPSKKGEIIVWKGAAVSVVDDSTINAAIHTIASQTTTFASHQILQGHEDAKFLQSLGGVMVTRQGLRLRASKQYMLRGRKHLGSFVFDEVPFTRDSLCAGFTHLISYPVTLQKINFYLWKTPACSVEEVSAARLAAMGLSDSGEIVEVDFQDEPAVFSTIFDAGKTNHNSPRISAFWHQKELSSNHFITRMFRIQPAESKGSLISSFLPAWSARSPAGSSAASILEAKHISPFMHSDLEAEGIYIFDANSIVYVLLGPLFKSAVEEDLRSRLFLQALQFARDYSSGVASLENRITKPKAHIVLAGTPPEIEFLFRHWNPEHGLWGTSGLMAGSTSTTHASYEEMGVEDLLAAMLRSWFIPQVVS